MNPTHIARLMLNSHATVCGHAGQFHICIKYVPCYLGLSRWWFDAVIVYFAISERESLCTVAARVRALILGTQVYSNSMMTSYVF